MAGREFNDTRTTNEKWLQEKNEKPVALGQLPVLFTEDGVFCQSNVIARYVAKKLGLMGDNLREETTHDLVVEVTMEFINYNGQNIYKHTIFGVPEPKNFAKVKEEVKEHITKRLLYIQSIAEKEGKEYIVSDEIGLADIWLYTGLELCRVAFPDIMDLTPWTTEFAAKFTSNKKIKSYLESRPPSQFHGL